LIRRKKTNSSIKIVKELRYMETVTYMGMSLNQITILAIVILITAIVLVGRKAYKQKIPTPTDYYLAGRGLGPLILVMTMGAAFFSMWTILGAFGSYYRSGIAFMCFSSWTVIHAVMAMLFGTRIWVLGKHFGFITPGEMMEHYYGSSGLRVLFAVVGIVALLPYMLIQITGGALTLTSFTDGGISYFWGAVIMSLVVGIYVAAVGFRGVAWVDTMLGIFFGSTMLYITVYVISKFGGINALKEVEAVAPHLLTNNGDWYSAMGTASGLLLGYWIMPHMWQKFYAAKSARAIGEAAALTPFWNSWLMAIPPLIIGIMANIPGLIPGLTTETSDMIIPMFFRTYQPLMGAIVIAAALSFGITTVSSQLLTCASIITEDVYIRFWDPQASEKRKTHLGSAVVAIITFVVFGLCFAPGATSFLIPVANIGFALGIQMVPAALGPLFWPKGTKAGAIASLIASEIIVVACVVTGYNKLLPPGLNGLVVGLVVYYVVSKMSTPVSYEIQKEYHGLLTSVIYKESLSHDRAYLAN
jgi:SSS family solute:Na+ symporter